MRPREPDFPLAHGCLKVSHRALDRVRTSERRPWHTHRRRDYAPLRSADEVVPVEIELSITTAWIPRGHRLRLVLEPFEGFKGPGGRADDRPGMVAGRTYDPSYHVGATNRVHTPDPITRATCGSRSSPGRRTVGSESTATRSSNDLVRQPSRQGGDDIDPMIRWASSSTAWPALVTTMGLGTPGTRCNRRAPLGPLWVGSTRPTAKHGEVDPDPVSGGSSGEALVPGEAGLRRL